MKLKYLFIIILTIFTGDLFAQFSVDGEFRSRFHAQHGFKIPVLNDKNTDFFFDQRSRIMLSQTGEKFSSRLTLQDARIWGNNDLYNNTGVLGNSYSLGIYEAWVDVKLNHRFNLKIGRQEWKYNDMRILSHRNIWTSGLTYDGILVKYANSDKKWWVDLGISYNNDGAVNGLEVYNENWVPERLKTMNFINIEKEISEKFTVSLMLTLSGKVDTSNNAVLGTGTHGLYLVYNNGKKATNGLFGNFSGYYQHGTDLVRGSDDNYRNVSAYLLAAELGIRTMSKKLELSIGSELLSGRDYTNTDAEYNNTRHSFDMLYGARFIYYGGNMNHFLLQDSYLTGTKGGGYANPYLKINYKLNTKSVITLGYYMPYLTSKVTAHTSINPLTNKPSGIETDASGNMVYWKGNLGKYVDLGWTQKFSKEISLKTGFSYAMISDIKNQMAFGYKDAASKELYDSSQNFYFWAMLIIKPNFFKQ